MANQGAILKLWNCHISLTSQQSCLCKSHIFLQSWSVQLQHFKCVFVFTFEIFPMWNSNINFWRFLPNIFPWHGHPCNYGALPQTWENPYHTDSWTGMHGDKVAIWEYLNGRSACWIVFKSKEPSFISKEELGQPAKDDRLANMSSRIPSMCVKLGQSLARQAVFYLSGERHHGTNRCLAGIGTTFS